MRGQGAFALAMVILLVAGAFAFSHDSAGGLLPATGADTVVVRAVGDYGYSPDLIENIATGANISVTFLDDDPSGMQHSFNISSREGFVIPTTWTAAQLNQLFGTYPALYSTIVNYTGAETTGWFESPSAPGWYEFVCNVSGHFELGMYGFIAFGENLPSNLTQPTRTNLGGLNDGTIGLIFGGVFLAAIVLIYLIARRRRAARARANVPAPRNRPGTPPGKSGDLPPKAPR
jgi:plastocyanin